MTDSRRTAIDAIFGVSKDVALGTVIHCNVFDRDNGLVDPAEQRRCAGQADASVESIAEILEPRQRG